MKFAICNEIFQGWTLEDTFAFAAKTGYHAVEIAPFTIAKSVLDISPEQRRKIKELAAGHHIEISGIHWVLVQTEGLHLTHPDDAVRKRTSDYLVALVDFCADLGGKFIVAHIGYESVDIQAVGYPDAPPQRLAVGRPSPSR